MKNILLYSMLFLFLQSCKEENGKKIEALVGGKNADMIKNPATANAEVVDTVTVAKVVFVEKSFNFGDIKAGKSASHTFVFTNTGKVPLLIKDCYSSCGCTIPSYPKEPVEPGKSSKIDVKFDSKGKDAKPFSKEVHLVANTFPNETTISIEGRIVE